MTNMGHSIPKYLYFGHSTHIKMQSLDNKKTAPLKKINGAVTLSSKISTVHNKELRTNHTVCKRGDSIHGNNTSKHAINRLIR
jgi:hypothetical protein